MNKEQILTILENLKKEYLECIHEGYWESVNGIRNEIKYWEKRLKDGDYYE